MCINEAVCSARMAKVDELEDDLKAVERKLSTVESEIVATSKELAVAASNLERLSVELKELISTQRKCEEDMRSREEERKKMHPAFAGVLAGIATTIFGYIILEILNLTF